MALHNSDRFKALKKEMLSLHGFKASGKSVPRILGLKNIENAMPGNSFPLGAVHEMLCGSGEALAATTGFTTALISKLFSPVQPVIWISNAVPVFTPGLLRFGIQPANIIFVKPPDAKTALWLAEESLQCTGVAAVIAELPEISFLHSRRFQLAVEKSHATGFIFNTNPAKTTNNACVSRWQITHLASATSSLPGVGFPQWKIDLQKIRNGRKGSWSIGWRGRNFTEIFSREVQHEILLPAKAM